VPFLLQKVTGLSNRLLEKQAFEVPVYSLQME
jgi:hypothetical protein